MICNYIFEEPNFPDCFFNELFPLIAQQLNQKLVHIHNLSGFCIEDKNTIPCRFKEATIACFRNGY